MYEGCQSIYWYVTVIRELLFATIILCCNTGVVISHIKERQPHIMSVSRQRVCNPASIFLDFADEIISSQS